MLSDFIGEFGLLDIIVLLNYFNGRKANKNLKRLQKLQIVTSLWADDDLDEIVKILKEIKNEKQD